MKSRRARKNTTKRVRKNTTVRRSNSKRQHGGVVIDCSLISPSYFIVETVFGPGSVGFPGIPEIVTLVEKHKSKLLVGDNSAFIAEYRAIEPHYLHAEVKDAGGKTLKSFAPTVGPHSYTMAPPGGIHITIQDVLKPLNEAVYHACKFVSAKVTRDDANRSHRARIEKLARNAVNGKIDMKTMPHMSLSNKRRIYNETYRRYAAEKAHAKATNLLGLLPTDPVEKNLLIMPSHEEELRGLFGPAAAAPAIAGDGTGGTKYEVRKPKEVNLLGVNNTRSRGAKNAASSIRIFDEEELLRQYLSSTSSTPDAKTVSGPIIEFYRKMKRGGEKPEKDVLLHRLDSEVATAGMFGSLPAVLAHALRGEKEEMMKYIK